MTMQQAPHSKPLTRKPFTGRHMTAILVAGFGVVFAVNFTMASLASSTFGGVVVENSYVASQHFNRWLDEAAREKSLGWRISAARRADGHVAATLAGVPQSATIAAIARHPLGRLPDTRLTFVREADGTYASRETLATGRWMVRFDVEAGGKAWRGEQPVS